jgi:hypothetical protein
MSNADQPTQFQIKKVSVDGQDIKGLLVELDYYESIYIPASGGTLTIMDSVTAGFIEENKIEFIEDFEFEFTNAMGESIQFEGILNGLRNEVAKQQLKMYSIDFTSKPVRKNEQEFVVKRFKNKSPKDVVEEMVELIEGEMDKSSGSGEPMNFTGNRRRPTDIIKYVCAEGLSGQSNVSEPNSSQSEPQQKEIKGTTGFLCWETIDGYRFAPVKDILEGSAGNETEEFEYRLQNIGETLEEAMTGIVSFELQQIGDYQSHQRGGAFRNKLISYDMDTGLYTEFEQEDKEETSQKMAEETKKPSRFFCKPFQNEKFENEGTKAQDNKYDQSRKYLSQNAVSQNNAPDTLGQFSLPLTPTIRAGDVFKCKIYKVDGEESGGGFDQKHSGKYVIKQVGHHFGGDGRAYTRLNTLRSTKQQNDASS